MNVEELKEKIKLWNLYYRKGESLVSDEVFDEAIDQLRVLSPNDPLLNEIGEREIGERKDKLPFTMASMNKIKTIEEMKDWIRLKNLNPRTEVVITPKYDGMSFLVEESTNKAWTRGDGLIGHRSDEHYTLISNHLKDRTNFQFTYGELIMSKRTFMEKYAVEYSNPRNLVAGVLNSKDVSSILGDIDYIKYGGVQFKFKRKSDLLDELNINQDVKVPYEVISLSDINEDLLSELFKEYSKEYEIDGLIIEVNDLELQNELGRETSTNNPVWARAYKSPLFSENAVTSVIGVEWNISKQGLLKPVILIKSVKLDGAIVSRVTGNNARFVKEMGIGIGSEIIVRRSGMVIPIIDKVLVKKEFIHPNIPCEWNDNGIELVTTTITDEQRIKQNISFFEILETENVSDGIIRQLWDLGYRDIKDILDLKSDDLKGIEGFGDRRIEIILTSIKKAIDNVSLYKLQHASGMFQGLGSKKLALLEHFTEKPSVDEVMRIDGFAEKSATVYVENYDLFFEFMKELNITIEKNEIIKESDKLNDKSFCFSGVRRKDLEDIIRLNGGEIKSGVSKNLTHLVMKAKGSGSSKEKKALDLGIVIMTVEELEQMLDI